MPAEGPPGDASEATARAEAAEEQAAQYRELLAMAQERLGQMVELEEAKSRRIEELERVVVAAGSVREEVAAVREEMHKQEAAHMESSAQADAVVEQLREKLGQAIAAARALEAERSEAQAALQASADARAAPSRVRRCGCTRRSTASRKPTGSSQSSPRTIDFPIYSRISKRRCFSHPINSTSTVDLTSSVRHRLTAGRFR